MTKKTHTEVKSPQISIRHLADYMAASERTKRRIVDGCRYRPIAKLVQHKEAKAIVANFLRSGSKKAQEVIDRASGIRGRMTDDEFEAEVNEHNADYLDRFASVFEKLNLPDAEILPGKKLSAILLNGVKVTFEPDLILQRTTKTNKVKSGAVMFRYAKGKALREDVGLYQSAAIHGYLRTVAEATASEVERSLCLTLDCYLATPYEAPGDSISRFSDMKAACQTIAERWPNIKAPKNAVL